MFDKNKDGFVSADELKLIMENSGQKVTDEEINEFMKFHDTDQNGELSFEEFLSWWKTLEE